MSANKMAEGWLHAEKGHVNEEDCRVARLPKIVLPSWVPTQKLFFADEDIQFSAIPDITNFGGYWRKVEEECTPLPSEVHDVISATSFAIRCHKSIAGIKISDKSKTFSVYSRLTLIGHHLPFLHIETYNKDNSVTKIRERRDFRLGSMNVNMYYTTTGVVILRVELYGLLSSTPDFVGEDYISMMDDGKRIKVQQSVIHLETGRRATQYFVGKAESLPSKKQ